MNDDYYDPKEYRRARTKPLSKKNIQVRAIVFAIAAGAVIGYLLENRVDKATDRMFFSSPPAAKTFNLPPTGIMRDGTLKSDITASLKVVGATDQHCVLDLFQEGVKTSVLRLFIRSQELAEAKVPLGKYRVSFSCGSNWNDGSEFGLFSPTLRALSPMVFRQDQNGGIWGHTIDLTRRVDGNMMLDAF